MNDIERVLQFKEHDCLNCDYGKLHSLKNYCVWCYHPKIFPNGAPVKLGKNPECSEKTSQAAFRYRASAWQKIEELTKKQGKKNRGGNNHDSKNNNNNNNSNNTPLHNKKITTKQKQEKTLKEISRENRTKAIQKWIKEIEQKTLKKND